MNRFVGYDWTSAPRTCADLTRPEKIGQTSWIQDEGEYDTSYSTEYWVLPDGSAEIRRYGEAESPHTEVLPPGTWEVRRDWPSFACRSGEYVERVCDSRPAPIEGTTTK
jgi:hypothetical protein